MSAHAIIRRWVLVLRVTDGALVDRHDLSFLQTRLVRQGRTSLGVIVKWLLRQIVDHAGAAGERSLVRTELVDRHGLRNVTACRRRNGDNFCHG